MYFTVAKKLHPLICICLSHLTETLRHSGLSVSMCDRTPSLPPPMCVCVCDSCSIVKFCAACCRSEAAPPRPQRDRQRRLGKCCRRRIVRVATPDAFPLRGPGTVEGGGKPPEESAPQVYQVGADRWEGRATTAVFPPSLLVSHLFLRSPQTPPFVGFWAGG